MTPLVRSVGTGRIEERTSRAAGLSKTTNWPLRGVIRNGEGRAIASTRSPKLPAALTTTRASIGPLLVARRQPAGVRSPPVTSVRRRTSPPWAIPCSA